jgi:hypothetical protein
VSQTYNKEKEEIRIYIKMITENEEDDLKKISKIKKRDVKLKDGTIKNLPVSDGIGFQQVILTKLNSETTKYTSILIGVATSVKKLSKIIFNLAAKSVAKGLQNKVEKNFDELSKRNINFEDLDPKVSFFYEQFLELLNQFDEKIDVFKDEIVLLKDEIIDENV